MKKYLFITYGQPGWRGVQIRALRIAKYLPKDEILFWNMYDSNFLENWGFDFEDKNPGIVNPDEINFPPGLETVIFSDIPSNEFFQFSTFITALKRNLKIVICEQLYNRNQMSKGLFKKFLNLSDLFLVNSISYFKKLETEKLKIIPPQIEMEFNPETRKEICQKYTIPNNSVILFGAGYNQQVFDKIKKISKELAKKNDYFYTIVSGPGDLARVKKEGRLIILPFNIGDDYYKLLYSADVVLVKFGFLQILESMALYKPTIVLGEAGFVLKYRDVVDEVIKKSLRFDLELTDETYKYIEKLIIDERFRRGLVDNLKRLHNGELFGAKKAAEEIIKLSQRPKKTIIMPKRKLAILINNEIYEKETWLKENDDIYPLCFVIAMPTNPDVVKRIPQEILEKKVKDLQFYRNDEPLPHSFKDIKIFSIRKLDGFLDIFPWYEDWLNQLEHLLEKSDEIYITKEGLKIFGALINKKMFQSKLICL